MRNIITSRILILDYPTPNSNIQQNILYSIVNIMYNLF
jgi:hypothetical protein